MATHATRKDRSVEQIAVEASEIPNGQYPLWTTNDVKFLLETIKEQNAKIVALRRYVQEKT